jgi:glycine/D-amino acid oxidase-like deaminating enzyme
MGAGATAAALERRYRARSLWLDGCPSLTPRPPLDGDTEADVAIAGAGFTGLWSAYALAELDASLRIIVVEAETAGYGASGRNAGFVSAGIAGEAGVFAREHGAESVERAERACIEAIDQVGSVVAAEGIDCGWVKGGSLRIATSPAQWKRVQTGIEARRGRGVSEQDVWLLSAEQIQQRVRVQGALGGTFTPHCARADPARLARGLAEACERRGVRIYERTAARHIGPGAIVCDQGSVHAPVVLRATESYTTRLPGQSRAYLPLFAHMLATEPLPDTAWAEIGWAGCETTADQHHLFHYAQRTPDGRIVFGGGSAPYHLGGRIRERDETPRAAMARLERGLGAWFPQAAGARITHRWGGSFAVPRDWSMAVRFDPATGLGMAGGYSGHGVIASHLAGRALADLATGRETELTAMPWVGRRSPRWEREPLRFAGARSIAATLRLADAIEDRTGRVSRLPRLVARWTPSR